MKPNELLKNLRQLNNPDLALILLFVLARWLRHQLTALHPVRLVIPVVTLQVILFAIAAGVSSNFLYTLALGNLILTALALLPIILPRRPRYHWIRPHE